MGLKGVLSSVVRAALTEMGLKAILTELREI